MATDHDRFLWEFGRGWRGLRDADGEGETMLGSYSFSCWSVQRHSG
jgi:hypothetical protein